MRLIHNCIVIVVSESIVLVSKLTVLVITSAGLASELATVVSELTILAGGEGSCGDIVNVIRFSHVCVKNHGFGSSNSTLLLAYFPVSLRFCSLIFASDFAS